MGFVWSITAGEALTAGSIVLGMLGAFYGLRADVLIVKHDLDAMADKILLISSALNQLSSVLTQVAVQDNRMNRIEDDLRELRHGEGMVLPLHKSRKEVP